MTTTPTPNYEQRFEQIEQAILQLADGQNVLFDAVTRIANTQVSHIDSQRRLEEIVETTRIEVSQSIAGINTTLASVSETLASLQAASEHHDRVLDYLLRRDRENPQ